MKKRYYIFFSILFIVLSIIMIINKSDKSILDSNNLLMIAHRGASLHAPEHTIEAYDLARENKADYIEIDLQMTKDNELIAMHDKKINRTTNGTGKISELTLNHIKKLDAGKWFDRELNGLSVATLEEIIQKFGTDVNYYIETKYPKNNFKMEKLLIKTLREYELLENASQGNVVIQSFSEESLRKIKELDDKIPLIQLQGYDEIATISKNELEHINNYAVGIGVNSESITKEFVEKVSNQGILVHAYTVNDLSEMNRLKELGVNGIFTDNKDLYK